MRLAMHRQVFGIHAPLRHHMEKAILGSIQTRLPCLPSSRLGLDILSGKDESLGFDDVLNGASSLNFYLVPDEFVFRSVHVHAPG